MNKTIAKKIARLEALAAAVDAVENRLKYMEESMNTCEDGEELSRWQVEENEKNALAIEAIRGLLKELEKLY